MKTLQLVVLASALLIQASFAQAPKVEIKPDETVQSLLTKQVGKRVELHLKGGEKFDGKLESATGNSVHLSSLAGQEFFDAVIVLDQVSAVVVRVR